MTSAPAVDQLITLLTGRRFTVLTGAGISTDSGIPDYRGPDSPPRTPMTYQQFVSDDRFRRHYWARNHVGWRHLRRTDPNDGHRALARLEQRGLVTGVITQNVDLLHQAAGSQRVIDLHGHYNEVICLNCATIISRSAMHERLESLNPDFTREVGDVEIAPDADAVIETTDGFVVPDCEVCGGMLKPHIVYFGENVPKARVAEAFALVESGDALLVAGSSLTVLSGLRFVRAAHKQNMPVAIINRGTTRGDHLATLRIHAGTSEALTALDAAL
ncbi:NAD-dependent protein deacetylase [Ruania halotolerans]|uniref:NAD-dependent protein deacetylase n=1 Tax=Ruania halotolerans TaxID=2897773 RepID=UPI001E4B4F69|nr:NAD-dependent protein deacetylase [Ruania halotolerans]UFU07076.1 NAD-dependent protein deacetylase [Ruania halotolerans]